MHDLYFIRRSDEAVWVYSACGEGRWRRSRMAPCQTSKVRHMLLRGPKGWMVQDQSPGKHAGGSCIAVPSASASTAEAAQGSGSLPPLGLWRSADSKCEFTLSDRCPECPPIESPMLLEASFATLRFAERGSSSRLEVRFANKSITDERLELVFTKARELLLNLARRPDMTLLVLWDLRDAGVPGMRHVRKFMAFAKEMGDLLDLFVRGNAIVLKPTGLAGSAMVSIIRMLQRILQAAWPECIVPTIEEADRFLVQQPASATHLEAGAWLETVDVKLTELHAAPPDGEPAAPPRGPAPEPERGVCTPPRQQQELKNNSRVPGDSKGVVGSCKDFTHSFRRSAARVRPGSVAAPELLRLEVPVWAEMGYRPRARRAGSVDSKVVEPEVPDRSAAEAGREEVLCSCTVKRRARFAPKAQPLAHFSL
mmetsp:Transcript_51070/g.145794  ORF Transcript_51070/g.145794 Transcript_51070/m.145794 type:complete len:424 (-) Transcript_51070:159-1430(-)